MKWFDIINGLAHDALTITQDIIQQYGSRPSCSDSSRKTAVHILRRYQKYCDYTATQSFTTHPKAFLGFLMLVPVIYVCATILLLLDFFISAALGFTIANIIAVSQFILYKGYFDFLYPKATGINAIGIINPKKEVRQQLIISGHHDSAYEFRYMRSAPKLYRLRVASIIISICLSLILSWILVINQYAIGSYVIYRTTPFIFLILGIFIFQMFFFKSNHATPGAGDNLISSAITIALARHFNINKNRPNYTKIIFVSFDAEECGLKGSQAFVDMNKEMIQSLPTFHFNIDSIYRIDLIKFLTCDINGFVPLSKEFAAQCNAIAHQCGYQSSLFSMYPGTGATDAASTAVASVFSTTLIALPTQIEKEVSVYHTMNDTVNNIQPEVVAATIEITIKIAQWLDKEIRGIFIPSK
ncbi:MAG: M28 family metallopeptidase [Spirochaetota bacterium]